MKKILVVDDIPHNLALIDAILKKKFPEYEIILAKSGMECLEIAEKDFPDTILLDVNMPGINGFEACKLLKKNQLTASIPVLMVSAYGGDPKMRVDGLEAGADAFITKPFDHAELLALVKVMLRIKSAEDLLRYENKSLETTIKNHLNETIQNEQRLVEISDFVNEFYWEVDQTLTFTYLSPTIENILGYIPNEIRLKSKLYDFISPEYRPEIAKQMLEVVERTGTFNRSKILCHNTKGNDIWLMLSGFPVFTKAKTLKGYRGVFQNITQRMRDEEKHTLVINTSIDGFMMTDGNNHIIEVNDAYCQMTGFSQDELLGKNFIDLDIGEEILKRNDSSNKSKNIGQERFETKHLCKNNQCIDIEISLNNLNLVENQLFIFIRDISERKLSEASKAQNLELLQVHQNKLRNLQQKLASAEESERKKMAELLHDGIGQNLAIAYLKLSSIGENSNADKTQKVIGDSLSLINNAIKESRSLTYDLSPPILYELGLVSALKWKLDQVLKDFGIESKIIINKEPLSLKNETAILVFRIFSELLNNIIKHAKASFVEITIEHNEFMLNFQIKDNGKGFDTNELYTKSIGFGLFNIRERIESLQGNIEIISVINRGTTINFFIPN